MSRINKLNFAVIAHDAKKADMVAFIMKRLDFFKNVNIFATGTTGTHIEFAGCQVNKLKSGPLGGDAQIAAMIVDKKIDCVIFFIDPLSSHPHEVDVQMLLRICNVTDTPIATNYSTSSKLVNYFENEESN
jgi:methylglyoxal synthase